MGLHKNKEIVDERVLLIKQLKPLTKKQFIARFEDRPLSYSQKSKFEYDPDAWFDDYVLGIKEPPNALMEFGTLVGDSIGTENSMVPSLVPPGVKEYEMKAYVGNVLMIGFADHYCPDILELNENKTSPTKDRWTQKKVDEHEQLTMYCLLLFLLNKTKPEDVAIWLNFMRTRLAGTKYKLVDQEPLRFPTKRSMLQITQYSGQVLKTVDEMYAYYCHKLKST